MSTDAWRAWLPVYRPLIEQAAAVHEIEPVRLAALVWQETGGGVRFTPGEGTVWSPRFLYRYEPGFWARYLEGKPEWAPPASDSPAVAEVWKRRVSASYGLCQLMYPTAVWLRGGEFFEPEDLFSPALSLDLACRLLRVHLRAGRTWRQALAAYNTGRARDDLTDYDDQVSAKESDLRAAGTWV